MYEEKKKTRENLEFSIKCMKKRRRQERTRIQYEMYEEKKKTRENLESSMKCTKKRNEMYEEKKKTR